VVSLTREVSVNPQVIIYLNRLSDLLFVLARVFNDHGKEDLLWVPGQGQGSAPAGGGPEPERSPN
jgi:cob(I)alamin adenosyltransferase